MTSSPSTAEPPADAGLTQAEIESPAIDQLPVTEAVSGRPLPRVIAVANAASTGASVHVRG